MKATLVTIALILGCQRSASTSVVGSDPSDRESYSLGYQLGTSLKKQNTSIQLAPYVSGLRDALAGTSAQVSEQELQAAVVGLRNKAVQAQQGKRREQADKNRAVGAAFLEANRRHDAVKVLPSGLQYRVLQEGTGDHPTEAGTVTVNYRSSLIDGKELSNSFTSGQPVTVDLHRVIPGWREAIPLMREGAKWELAVPPELAYGSRGSTGIEPESTLVFEVQLLRANAEQRVAD